MSGETKCADADRHIFDQNVMCMRSGLVIKTAPVLRSSLSSRFQLDGRAPRDLNSGSVVVTAPRSQQQSPSPPLIQSGAETIAGDSGEPTASATGPSASGTAKCGGVGRSYIVSRPRSLDFLSIVTRFQLARRARELRLGSGSTGDNLHDDEDWMFKELELDFISDDTARRGIRCVRTGAELRSPVPIDTVAERRVLRRRRRRSQFATAAAAALQAAVSRAAAAASRPRFTATSPRRPDPACSPVGPLMSRAEGSGRPTPMQCEDDESCDVQICDVPSGEPGCQLTCGTVAETQSVRLTPSGGGGVQTPALGAFVDVLPRPNYIYVQPYSGDTPLAAGNDPTTTSAATGSLTDLFGRVAAVPGSPRDAAAAATGAQAVIQLASPSSVPVTVASHMAVSKPVTMFKIVGGRVGSSQPQQIMAYRPGRYHSQPVLLPATAIRSPDTLRQSPPSATVHYVDLGAPSTPPLKLFAHQLMSVPATSPVQARASVSAAAGGSGDVDVGLAEAEAYELTYDASGRAIHRCRLCARVFTVLSAFRSHVVTTHCRAKNQCAVCGKHFSRSWLLKGHMRTHTGERPYRCPHVGCDRAFADKSNLRSHLLIHNADGKHYVCTRCNRAFAQKRYLHKHRLEVCKY